MAVATENEQKYCICHKLKNDAINQFCHSGSYPRFVEGSVQNLSPFTEGFPTNGNDQLSEQSSVMN